MIEPGKFLRSSLVAAFAATASATVAQAQENSKLIIGSITSVPIGYVGGENDQGQAIRGFCKKYPLECRVTFGRTAPEKMDAQKWQIVERINAEVNKRVVPVSDMKNVGVEEDWDYPVNDMGDCEDYSLEKRKELVKEGFLLPNLLITVLKKPDGEGHAVLTVRTQDGDFALDNLTQEIKPVHLTGYTYLKLISPDNFRHFRNINGVERIPAVDAIATASTDRPSLNSPELGVR